MLAPLSIAISVAPRVPRSFTYRFSPATESAPAGSATLRVSSNTSLMAAQISSVDTSTTSSTHSRATRKVSSPI